MRQVTENGLELIRRFEGFSAEPYYCPAGYLTVGYGHVLRPGEEVDTPITCEQALAWLEKDVRTAARAVLQMIRVPLTDGQFDALVSFTYNLGGGALQRSTLRRKVNRREHEEAPHEFGKWVYGGGRRLRGLVRRRAAEAARYQA